MNGRYPGPSQDAGAHSTSHPLYPYYIIYLSSCGAVPFLGIQTHYIKKQHSGGDEGVQRDLHHYAGFGSRSASAPSCGTWPLAQPRPTVPSTAAPQFSPWCMPGERPDADAELGEPGAGEGALQGVARSFSPRRQRICGNEGVFSIFADVRRPWSPLR